MERRRLPKVVDGADDPKRLLELVQEEPSPNVLVQNLLGAARTEAAPEGVKRRARRSVERSLRSLAEPEAPSDRLGAVDERIGLEGPAAHVIAPERRPGATGRAPCRNCPPLGT